MACNCVDEYGSFRDACIGTCSQKKFEQVKEQIRAQDDKFSNAQLNQLKLLLSEDHLEGLWIDGFLRGFDHGRQS